MMSARAGIVAAAALLAATASHAGCASETLAPAPVAVPGAGGADDRAGGAAGAGGSGGAAPVKRTVTQRNPFGDVARSDNLLWDGDFEWLTTFSDQDGWLTGNGAFISYNLPKQVLGARCKSGVKCAEMGPDAIFIGTGVASVGHALAASFYATVDGNCYQIDAAVVTQSSFDNPIALQPETPQPVDGWCHFAANVPEVKAAAWLYIHNGGKAASLLDDASLQPIAPKLGASAPGPQGIGQQGFGQQGFGQRSTHDFRALRRQVAQHQKPHPRPRSEAEQRFLDRVARERNP